MILVHFSVLITHRKVVRFEKKEKGENMFKDKVLLITGGTGSFGNAVLKDF
jgi:FlaA1/EpsC-like NDP-sugar epimerase